MFEEEEEETEVEIEEETEEFEEEEETEDEEGAPPESGEATLVKANKKMFWIGLITLLIGSQGVSLGSLVHNTLGIFVQPGNRWGSPGSAKVYGYLDQTAGLIGIVLALIGMFLLILYMKKQSEEEKYREEFKENLEEGEEIPEDLQEPLLVQNKLFFWIGLVLVLITGPMGVIMGLVGGQSVDTIGAYGLGGGATLTVIGIILLFLAIWQRKSGEEEGEEETEEGEEEYGEVEEETDEELEEELEEVEELEEE